MASKVIRRIVLSPQAPAPVGAYSQGVIIDKTLYVSGTLGINPKTGNLPETAADQAAQSMKNIKAVVEEAGVSMKNVVKATILMANIEDFTVIDSAYKQYFPENPPARAAFAVKDLPKGAKVEIEAIVAMGEIQDEPLHPQGAKVEIEAIAVLGEVEDEPLHLDSSQVVKKRKTKN